MADAEVVQRLSYIDSNLDVKTVIYTYERCSMKFWYYNGIAGRYKNHQILLCHLFLFNEGFLRTLYTLQILSGKS